MQISWGGGSGRRKISEPKKKRENTIKIGVSGPSSRSDWAKGAKLKLDKKMEFVQNRPLENDLG